MDVLAMRFLAVGFVLVPLAPAITVELLVANSIAAPLVLVTAGFAFFVIGASSSVVMEDNPAWVFVPFLVTAGAVAAVLGCAWLVAVDLRVGLVVIALLVAGAIAWKRTAPHAI